MKSRVVRAELSVEWLDESGKPRQHWVVFSDVLDLDEDETDISVAAQACRGVWLAVAADPFLVDKDCEPEFLDSLADLLVIDATGFADGPSVDELRAAFPDGRVRAVDTVWASVRACHRIVSS